jgi:hypothetical protein
MRPGAHEDLKAHISELEAARDLPEDGVDDPAIMSPTEASAIFVEAIKSLPEDEKLDVLVAVCRAAGFAPSRVVDHESTRRKAAAVIREAPGKSAKRIYTLTCKSCGESFETQRPNASFCSNKCKKRHYRAEENQRQEP